MRKQKRKILCKIPIASKYFKEIFARLKISNHALIFTLLYIYCELHLMRNNLCQKVCKNYQRFFARRCTISPAY